MEDKVTSMRTKIKSGKAEVKAGTKNEKKKKASKCEFIL